MYKTFLERGIEHMESTPRSLRLHLAVTGRINAGKSTLLNRLTGAGILEADMLFATLDPTTRNYTYDNGQEILFTDTVGFIRKLPHHLIEAFGSTLEEAKYADMILHVIDASDVEADLKAHVVYETLKKLGIKDKPVISVFNKSDMVFWDEPFRDAHAEATLMISAKTGEGIDQLLRSIEEVLRSRKLYFEGIIDYADAGLLSMVRKSGQLVSEEYKNEGIFVKAYVTPEVFGRISSVT